MEFSNSELDDLLKALMNSRAYLEEKANNCREDGDEQTARNCEKVSARHLRLIHKIKAA